MPLASRLLAALLALAPLPAAADHCSSPDPATNLDDRIADCEQSLSQVYDRSGFPHLVYNLGRAYRLAGRAEEGLPLIQEVLAYQPKNALYWAELGHVMTALGQPSGAVAAYGMALQVAPQETWWAADRAAAWLALGDGQACLADLATGLPALKGGTDEWWYVSLQGRCHLALGQGAAAVAAQDAALALEPGGVDILSDRANALASLGRYDEALADLATALATPDLDAGWDIWLRGSRIDLLRLAGRPAAETTAEITALTTNHPDDLDAVNLVAWAWFGLGELAKADAAAEPLRDPDVEGSAGGYMLDTLGQIDLAQGRTDAAWQRLSSAAWLDPGVAQSWAPALAAQGFLPLTRVGDDLVAALWRCIEEKAAACSLLPLPKGAALATITVARPDPGGDAPEPEPAFEPGPEPAPETPVPAGIGAKPRPVAPAP